MGEPKYDEDSVNLGYLNKRLSSAEEEISSQYENVSRNYGSKPNPPYYKGDTWIDGNIVYTCINTRTIGLYNDEDWTTESGAKEEAKTKNKTYLTKPEDYNAGDMWILQSDTDHPEGKKGEILVTTVGRKGYEESDWKKKVSYSTIDYVDSMKEEIDNNFNDITERTVEISTNLGQISSQVTETTTRLNNDYLTAEQIEAENQTLKDDIDIIKQQQTTVTTTAQGLQVQIDQINNEGVKSVKNTTVDINEAGVSVGKSDSEFSTTMNNTGTYMYAYGKQIAKYDKDGMETADLKATGEVEMGYLKLMKTTVNSEKRTHIHWIGG